MCFMIFLFEIIYAELIAKTQLKVFRSTLTEGYHKQNKIRFNFYNYNLKNRCN